MIAGESSVFQYLQGFDINQFEQRLNAEVKRWTEECQSRAHAARLKQNVASQIGTLNQELKEVQTEGLSTLEFLKKTLLNMQALEETKVKLMRDAERSLKNIKNHEDYKRMSQRVREMNNVYNQKCTAFQNPTVVQNLETLRRLTRQWQDLQSSF